jgi:hypothetical protein
VACLHIDYSNVTPLYVITSLVITAAAAAAQEEHESSLIASLEGSDCLTDVE